MHIFSVNNWIKKWKTASVRTPTYQHPITNSTHYSSHSSAHVGRQVAFIGWFRANETRWTWCNSASSAVNFLWVTLANQEAPFHRQVPPPASRGEGRGWRWARRRHVLHGNDARPEDGGRDGWKIGPLGFRPGPEPVALERFFMGPRRFTPVGRALGKRYIYSCLLGQFSSLPAPRPLWVWGRATEGPCEGKVIREAMA